MKVARSVAEVLAEHTTLTLECIDRMYLNVYVPCFRGPRGRRTSSARCGARPYRPRP